MLAKAFFTIIARHTDTRNLEIPMNHEARIKLLGFSLNLDVPPSYNILENTIHTPELGVEKFRTTHLENFLRHFYHPGQLH